MKYRIFGTISVLAILVVVFLATGQDSPKGQVNTGSAPVQSSSQDTAGFGALK